MNKPVIRSPLEMMPLHQKQALTSWLTTGGKNGIGISYEKAAARLLKEFGVKTGPTALSHFYRRRRAPRAIEQSYNPERKTLTVVIHLNHISQ